MAFVFIAHSQQEPSRTGPSGAAASVAQTACGKATTRPPSAWHPLHGLRSCFVLCAFFFGLGFGGVSEAFAGHHQNVSEAIEQAHAQLGSRFMDPHGVLLDYVGETPSPEDCRLGRPNVIGWWSPIENGPMFTGLYLAAASERARRSGRDADKSRARQLAQGLLLCASVSDVASFIARGVGTDGRCHYPLGSDDQTHPWFYGLHAYLRSGLPTPEEASAIRAKVASVANGLHASGWKCPCDGAFTGDFRGGFTGHLFRDAVRYLYLLRATHEITGDPKWMERYQGALQEKPFKSEHTRLQICAGGYGQDREAIQRLDQNQLWIYVGSQGSLARLIAMESVSENQRYFRTGLALNAQNAAAAISGFRSFDNSDTKYFGNADWRKSYPDWFPQPTQAEAARLALMGDKAAQGERRGYERAFVRNPLAACAIAALGCDGAFREPIEEAIRHYDYSKLYTAEFFFAECAFYALPER